jgi:anti-sigma-K factor RskA
MSLELHVEELLAAYALDCLDEGEKEEVTRHLAHCAQCRSELKDYQEVAALLPFGGALIDPPPDLKTRLLAQVETRARPGPQPDSRPDHSLGWIDRMLGWTRRSAPLWGTVSLVLVVLLGISNLLLWGQVRQMQSTRPSQMQFVRMSGTQAAPSAQGVIVISADGDHGTLVVDKLPPLQAGEQYQLWLIDDGQRTDGGVFSVDKDGYGSLWVSSSRPLVTYPSFGVTIEPQGGSPGPTGQKVLGGGL